MQVDFYHLTAALDRALPVIAGKVIASGERLVVVSADEVQRATIDRVLWTFAADSFLPHAQAGGDDDAAQPILIAGEVQGAPVNGARHIALVDGTWRDTALAFERAFHFFDDETIREARLAWKALGDQDGVERRYWKQTETGGWERAA